MEQQSSSSSSPRTSPVEIRDCIEELLHYIFQSHVNGLSEIDLRFSSRFSSDLLSLSSTTDTQCPLYKHLAAALCESIHSSLSFATNDETDMHNERSDLKNHQVWKELLLENGSQLLNILEKVNFELHVQEPFFSQLRDGIKTVEGRCAVGDYTRIGSGSLILFNKCLLLEVQEVRQYASFFEMLQAETLEKVLPGVKTIEEGVEVYRKFYSEGKERFNGVVGIHVMKPPLQPYIHLARILAEMGWGGIESLLGLRGAI